MGVMHSTRDTPSPGPPTLCLSVGSGRLPSPGERFTPQTVVIVVSRRPSPGGRLPGPWRLRDGTAWSVPLERLAARALVTTCLRPPLKFKPGAACRDAGARQLGG